MKIAGRTVNGLEPIVLVIPKGNVSIVFKAQPVLDFEEFDKLCPRPQPPSILKPGGTQFHDVYDKKYLEDLGSWSSNRMNWMILKSLSATEDLTWDTVEMSKSETWSNFNKELTQAGFSDFEVNKIIETVINACGLNEENINKATKSFLAGLQAQQSNQ